MIDRFVFIIFIVICQSSFFKMYLTKRIHFANFRWFILNEIRSNIFYLYNNLKIANFIENDKKPDNELLLFRSSKEKKPTTHTRIQTPWTLNSYWEAGRKKENILRSRWPRDPIKKSLSKDKERKLHSSSKRHRCQYHNVIHDIFSYLLHQSIHLINLFFCFVYFFLFWFEV